MASVLFAITSLLAVSKVQVTQFVMAKCPMSTSLHLDFARTVMSHKDLRCEIFSNKPSIFFIITLNANVHTVGSRRSQYPLRGDNLKQP